MQINAIGNDVVYMVTTEHTIETPLFKGGVNVAINATTGQANMESFRLHRRILHNLICDGRRIQHMVQRL